MPKKIYLSLLKNFADFATAESQEEKVSFLQKHLDQNQDQEYFDVLDHDFLETLELPTEHKTENNILEAKEEEEEEEEEEEDDDDDDIKIVPKDILELKSGSSIENQTPCKTEAEESFTSNLTANSKASSLLSIGTVHSETSITSESSSESTSINLDMPAQLFEQTQEHLNTVANNQKNESQKTILNKYHKNLFRLKTNDSSSFYRAGIAKDHNQLLATHRSSFRFSSPSFFSCTQSNGNKSIFPDDPLLATLDRLQREFNQLPGVDANQDIISSLKTSNKDNIKYYMRYETTPDQSNFILCAKVMFLRELAKPSSNEVKPEGKTSQGLAFEKVKELMNNVIIDLSTNTDEKISKKNQAYNRIYKKVFGDDSKPQQPKLAADYKDLLNLDRRHQFLFSLVKHKARAGQEVIETIESRFSAPKI